MKRGDDVVVLRRGRGRSSSAALPATSRTCSGAATVRRARRASATAASSRLSARRASPSAASAIGLAAASPSATPAAPSPRSRSPAARSSSADQRLRRQRPQREDAAAREQRRSPRRTGSRWWRRRGSPCPPRRGAAGASCCALLKRWISSMKSTGARPWARCSSARATASRRSFTPASTAESGWKRVSGPPAEQPRQGGLAAPRRSPEEERRQPPAVDQRAQRRAVPTRCVLPDHLVEAARPHAVGERRAQRRSGRRTALEEARPVALRHGASSVARVIANPATPPEDPCELAVGRHLPEAGSAPGGRRGRAALAKWLAERGLRVLLDEDAADAAGGRATPRSELVRQVGPRRRARRRRDPALRGARRGRALGADRRREPRQPSASWPRSRRRARTPRSTRILAGDAQRRGAHAPRGARRARPASSAMRWRSTTR